MKAESYILRARKKVLLDTYTKQQNWIRWCAYFTSFWTKFSKVPTKYLHHAVVNVSYEWTCVCKGFLILPIDKTPLTHGRR